MKQMCVWLHVWKKKTITCISRALKGTKRRHVSTGNNMIHESPWILSSISVMYKKSLDIVEPLSRNGKPSSISYIQISVSSHPVFQISLLWLTAHLLWRLYFTVVWSRANMSNVPSQSSGRPNMAGWLDICLCTDLLILLQRIKDNVAILYLNGWNLWITKNGCNGRVQSRSQPAYCRISVSAFVLFCYFLCQLLSNMNLLLLL